MGEDVLTGRRKEQHTRLSRLLVVGPAERKSFSSAGNTYLAYSTFPTWSFRRHPRLVLMDGRTGQTKIDGGRGQQGDS